MSSLEAVLKNIYDYIDILQTVCTDKVISWDRNNLQDALKWAKYCEQVYKQAQGKPYLEQLDQNIRRMGELPWAIGQRKLTLETLKEAETLLKQALLQNPNVSDSVYKEVMCCYGDPHLVPSSLVKDVVQVSSVVQASQVALACLPTPSLHHNNAVTSVNGVEFYSSAQILLEYTAELMSCPPERLEQCEKLLISKLNRIATDREGLEVVAIACSLPSVQSGSSKAQMIMVSWLLSRSQQSVVFCLPRHLLAEVSLVHFVFYKAYIHRLISATQNTEVVITKDGLLTYRLSGDISHTDLVSRFCSLMKVGEPVTSATLHTVEGLSIKDCLGVWRKLLNTLLTVKETFYKSR